MGSDPRVLVLPDPQAALAGLCLHRPPDLRVFLQGVAPNVTSSEKPSLSTLPEIPLLSSLTLAAI